MVELFLMISILLTSMVSFMGIVVAGISVGLLLMAINKYFGGKDV